MGRKSELEKELGKLGKNEILLTIVDSRKYQKTNLQILSHLTKKEKHECVYITLNRPYNNLLDLFKESKLDTSKFFFIDTLSETVGSTVQAENVLYISSPHGLTEMSIALNKALSFLSSEKKVVFFDSISTLLIYNKPEMVTKFVHFLVGKMRALGVKGVLMSLEEETDEHLRSQLSQFVDRVIELNGKKY